MQRNWPLTVILAPAMVLAACASQPNASRATADKVAKPEPRCLRETGSKVKRDACLASGRVVTREQLERTGGATLSEALNRVSPM